MNKDDNRNKKGISQWRNRNGFYVAQIHYTADPEKDPQTPIGKRWLESARKGMPEDAWRKEYEIDWFARWGQLVYSAFKRDKHVVMPFVIPCEWTRYMAIDPGLRNPTGMLWLACSPDEKFYIYREYYVSEKTVEWHARRIKEIEAGEKIQIRYIDPSSSNRNPLHKSSIRDEFARHGIYCVSGNNQVETGINRVNQWLTETVDEEGTLLPSRLYLFSNLFNTIKEITTYRWEEGGGSAGNWSESPVKRHDHLMDCLRYLVMGDPHYISANTDKEPLSSLPSHALPPLWDGMTTGYQ